MELNVYSTFFLIIAKTRLRHNNKVVYLSDFKIINFFNLNYGSIMMRLAQMILMTVMITFCIGVISDQSIACLITVIDSDISEHHRSWKILFINWLNQRVGYGLNRKYRMPIIQCWWLTSDNLMKIETKFSEWIIE